MTMISIMSVFLMTASISHPRQVTNDYSVTQVGQILQMPSGFRLSFFTKAIHRMGDRLSIALIKIHGQEGLKNPRKIERFLPLIRESFARPDLIENESDKQPNVALILLAFLEHETPDSEVLGAVRELAEHLKQARMPKDREPSP